MSTTNLLRGALGPDGVRRYRTRWKILVHSHQYSGVTNLSDAVINISLTKNIKSIGTCSFALTGERNILNLVYPNDYINVYCDRADGEGWTRVFFGYIDHVEEMRRVEPTTGKPTTMYSVQCSDFQKAFERTEIYFNPFLAGRADFDGSTFSTTNIGGSALRTRGLRVNGGPAELVTNTVLLLMGFGSQFLLPTSYNPRLRDRIRQQRAEAVLGRLNEDIRNQIMDQGGYAAFLENIRNQLGISSSVESLTIPDSPTAESVSRAELSRYSNAVARALDPGSSIGREATSSGTARGVEAYNLLNTTLAGHPVTLLDIVDINTFVERGAIDGYTNALSMWSQQDSVMSFMRSVSNEIVNEMFLDLRAVSVDGGLTAGSSFSKDLDEISGNAADSEGGTAGTLYLPALVLREYPYATITKIDASNVPITVRQRGATGSPDTPETETFGALWFGAIFSNGPNIPGRHVVNIPTINSEDLANGISNTTTPKHLDVAVVYDSEIVATRFSRSDTDHFNLFELLSDGMLGENPRYLCMDLLPIITPIHIMRHGLRTRSLNTRFARHALSTVNRVTRTPTETEEEEVTETAAEPVVPAASAPVLPIELISSGGEYTQGYVGPANVWHYRPKVFDGRRPINNVSGRPVPPAGTPYWRYHNGVDVVAPRGAPVYAVRDGVVVMAAPVGTRGRAGYGNIVMIYHEADDIYSLYAHLDSISENLRSSSRSTNLAAHASSRIRSGGRYVEIAVRAGDQIGTAGSTDCEGVHLHFEFNVLRAGRLYPSALDRTSGLTPDVFRDESTAVPGYPVSRTEPPLPPEDQTISQDPIRIFRSWGLTLPVGRHVADSGSPLADPPEDDTYPGDEGEFEDIPEVPVAPTEESTAEDPGETAEASTNPGFVDDASIRRLLARWALLNDHWYQHNLEYLSGSIEMHGAPEIRAGYRLDLSDRNMSFYVEGVSHNWSYGQPMTTTLQVTRGQPNNPYPSYVLPFLESFDATPTQRTVGSRLSAFFIIPDPISVRRALKLQRRSTDDPSPQLLGVAGRASPDVNEVDMPNPGGWWSEVSPDTVGTRYNENIIEATSVAVDPVFEAVVIAAAESAAELPGAGTNLTSVDVSPTVSATASEALAEAFDVLGSSTTGVT